MIDKDFCRQCHYLMKEKGFWHSWHYLELVGMDERVHDEEHKSLIINEKIGLIYEEILYEFMPTGDVNELADVFLRCADLCGFMGWEYYDSSSECFIGESAKTLDAVLALAGCNSRVMRKHRDGGDFEDELFHLMTTTAAFAKHLGEDRFFDLVKKKHEENKLRPHKHGKKF